MRSSVSIHDVLFTSPGLNQAWQSALPLLESDDDLRSRVSADIRALEINLQSLQSQTPFRMFIGQSSDSAEISTLIAKLPNASEQKQPLLIDEFLVLGRDPYGHTRLLFERALAAHPGYLGSQDIFYYQPGISLYYESRPLIEHKSAIRLQVFPKLPDFVLALAEDRRTRRENKPDSVKRTPRPKISSIQTGL